MSIRRAVSAQQAHSGTEELCYKALWEAGEYNSKASKTIAIGVGALVKATGLGQTSVRQALRGLEKKLALEVVGEFVPGTSTPKTYLIWCPEKMLERRAAAGLLWVERKGAGRKLLGKPEVNGKINEPSRYQDTMRPEYDMSGGVRGKYADRFPRDVVMVTLAPDVAEAFPDADSVNEALRVLLNAAKKVATAAMPTP